MTMGSGRRGVVETQQEAGVMAFIDRQSAGW